jgi:hydrogenase expression/formation protein HypC
MEVQAVDGWVARCSARGVEREVSLLFLGDDPPEAGEHVLVQLGQAVEKVSAEEAERTWALLDEILAAQGAGAPPV